MVLGSRKRLVVRLEQDEYQKYDVELSKNWKRLDWNLRDRQVASDVVLPWNQMRSI